MSSEQTKPVVAISASASEAAVEKSRLDAALAKGIARRESERKEAPRSRPPVPGGVRLKMSVAGEVPGYHLYWANDQNGEIEQLLYEGFEFVEPSEVRMQSHIVADADLGNRVSRYVGSKEEGSPLRAYLLKCPDEIWHEREAQRYAQADAWDADIRAGKVQSDDGRYKPKGVETSVDTKYRQ